jgi:thioredoxin 1
MAEHITDDNFDAEVLKSDVPVLVDFYAEWCGPCKMMAPAIDKLSKEYDGKFKIVKLDIDQNEKNRDEFQIQSIPTLIFFKKGKPVHQLVGYKSEEALRQNIEAQLKGGDEMAKAV